MPALSPTMEEGSIAAWTREEGELITAGEAICEIETDKATVDYELADDGYLAKILVKAKGDSDSKSMIKVGDVIGILVEEEEDVAAFKNFTVSDLAGSNASSTSKSETPKTKQQAKPKSSAKKEEVEAPPPTKQSETDRLFISPLARSTAKKEGVDITNLRGRGTGPKGRVVYDDVISFIKSGATAAQPVSETISAATTSDSRSSPAAQVSSGGYVDHPVESSSLTESLTESKKNVPHYFLTSELDVTELMKLRETLNLSTKNTISVNDFLIKAASLSMKAVPYVNSSFRGSYIRVFENCDVNVYNNKGASLIKKVNTKGLVEISKEVSEAETKGDDFQVGTFSVLNVGAFGVKSVQPIVITGQSASLGIGAITEELAPLEAVEGKDGDIFEVRYKLHVSLSCDHRVVDGAVGAQWMQHFKKLVENPTSMLL